jgi:hypothetical protein
MSIVLPALAVAFPGICIWLVVRAYNRREVWAKWTLAGLVGLPVLYIASFGPACWFCSYLDADPPALAMVYRPLLRLMAARPVLVPRIAGNLTRSIYFYDLNDGALAWYAGCLARDGAKWRYAVVEKITAVEPTIIKMKVKETWTWSGQQVVEF